MTADLLARQLDLPVLLYGALAQGRTRAELRRGGPAELARRLDDRRPHARLRPAATRIRPPAPRSSPRARRSSPSTSRCARPRRSSRRARSPRRIREGGPEGLPGPQGDRPAARAPAGDPGLDERRAARPTRRCATSSPRSRGTPSRRPPSWSASRPEAAFDGFPTRPADPRLRPRRAPDRARARDHLSSKADGPDEEEAPDEAPRQRRRPGRSARAHRSQTDRRRAQADGARAARGAARPAADVARRAQPRARSPPACSSCCCCSSSASSSSGRSSGSPSSCSPLYVPMGYYTDLFVYRRRQARRLRERPARRQDADE